MNNNTNAPTEWVTVPRVATQDMLKAARATGAGPGWSDVYPAMIEAAPPAPEAGWQPIETGPVNVEVLALYKGRRHVIAMQLPPDYSPGGWCHQEAFGNDGPFRGLTHWAPLLPAPPAGTNTTEATDA